MKESLCPLQKSPEHIDKKLPFDDKIRAEALPLKTDLFCSVFRLPADEKTILDSCQIFFFRIPSMQKRPVFAEKPRIKAGRLSKICKTGIIFIDQINIVPGRITDFKEVIPGAARSASDVVNLRGRLIPVLVAQKPRTIADVGIFQISEMFFVKKSGLFQKFPAVDRCSGAGRKKSGRTFQIH
mgnify:CR=1 FL=1